jgi:transposase
VNPESCDESVRRFGCFTADLEALADWLAGLGIRVVAMEATGVYWIALFELLESRGFEVHLVNSRATRQVSGRKSDVLDCQWIRELMSYGLLRAAFRPADAICRLRSLVRQRQAKVDERSQAILHMQKALVQMNIQLTNVLSDLAGKTGNAIVRAIVGGERDADALAALRDRRVKADLATVTRSLRGHWREEHLFALCQALEQHDFLGRQLADCDGAIGQALTAVIQVPAVAPPPAKPLARDKTRTAPQQETLRQGLYAVFGVDLTAIPTIGTETALVLAAEIGPDLSRFPTGEHFCSWLALAPPTRISGGKPLPGRAPKVVNRAGQALRTAAANARNSQTFIGAGHRNRLARMGSKSAAIKATAHQLARLIYAMITKGQAYVERVMACFEQERLAKQLHHLHRNAQRLGFQLVKETPTTTTA